MSRIRIAPNGLPKKPLQVRRGAAGLRLCDGVGCARGHDVASFVTGTRSHIDDPVTCRDDTHVVLDDNDRVTGVDECVELDDQLLDVGRMQSRRWFVEDVKCVTTRAALEFRRKFDALGFAARELGGRLPQTQVTDAHLA